MKLILIFISLTFSLKLIAQPTDTGYAEIEKWAHKFQPDSEIRYTAQIDSGLINYFLEAIRKGNINNLPDLNDKSSAKLSKQELKYIANELNKQKSLQWKDSLFKGARRIPNDSIKFYINGKVGTNKNTIFTFSEPIYIRNASVKIIYHMFMRSMSAGYQEWVFYRKVDNKWEKWITPLAGDW